MVDPAPPTLISWNLTQRCNLRCAHCYIDAATAAPDELDTGEALRVCDEIAALSPGALLILTGGEPLCRPDLETLAARAASRGLTVVCGTNGTGLTPTRARALAAAGVRAVGVSLDAPHAAAHDAFRRVPGAFDAARQGIAAARAAGLEVQVQCTLTRENVGDLHAMVALARSVGARVLTTFFLVCTGRGQGLVDLSPAEYEILLHRLAAGSDGDVPVRPRCAPTFRRVLRQQRPDAALLATDTGRCLAAREYFRITPSGDVTPCPYLPQVAGNLRRQALRDLWHDAPVLRALRTPRRLGRCGACEHADVCGGCRARAFAATGDALAEDPWCTHVPGTDPVPAAAPAAPVAWHPDATARLERIPAFVRRTVRRAVEARARAAGRREVTVAFLDAVRGTLMPGGRPPNTRA